MSTRAVLPRDATIRVVFTAPRDNPGNAAVASGWASASAPQSKTSTVKPATSEAHTHTRAPSDAEKLRLDIARPPGGHLHIRVTADGALIDEGDTSEDPDRFWEYLL